MASRRSLDDTGLFDEDPFLSRPNFAMQDDTNVPYAEQAPAPAPAPDVWNPGGTPTVPPTAQSVTPQVISPQTFNPSEQPQAIQGPYPAPTPQPLNVGSQGTAYPDYAWGGSATNGMVLAGMPLGTEQTAKRAATAYLASGVVDPNNKNWASQAVAYLNATYPQYGGGFYVIDGETLGMPGGNDYIHSAPVGYGIARGSYDPNARGEFYYGGYKDLNAPAGGSGGTGGGTGTAAARANPVGGMDLQAMIQQFLGGAPSPTSFTPAGTPLVPNLNQFAQGPLDVAINNALASVLTQGGTPNGQALMSKLQSIINGQGLVDPTNQRLIAARDAQAGAQQAMKADLRAALAERGMASEPGTPQGSEGLGLERIAYQLAPTFANAVTDIETHAMDTQNSNVLQALSLATGLDAQQANTLLSAVTAGTNRQSALADIALRTLDQNRQWQQFLAQFGLDRDQVAAQIQQGNMTVVIALINAFTQAAAVSAGGFI